MSLTNLTAEMEIMSEVVNEVAVLGLNLDFEIEGTIVEGMTEDEISHAEICRG